jgi:hypothetical protein
MNKKMKQEDVCSILATKLGEMQTSRKVDLSSLEIIKTAIDKSAEREDYWLSNKKIALQSAFVLYHAARNTRIVLEKMYERFLHAAEMRENPKVVDDAMSVIPELSEMCGYVDSLQNIKITAEVLEFVRRRTRNLRNTAQRVEMLPSIEEEMKAVDRKALARELNSVAEDLRQNLL